jgi:hypothetical protein
MRAFPAAHIEAEFMLNGRETALQCRNHTRSDSGGVPIHAHDRAKRLKPKRVCQSAQQFIPAIFVHYRFHYDASESRHSG